MKKMIAMLLAVLDPCALRRRMAESVPEADAAAEQAALADLTAEGQLIEGESFQFYIPPTGSRSSWVTVRSPRAMSFAAASADGANSLVITYAAMDAAMTAEEAQPGLAEVYPTATVQDLNGTSVVAFHDAEEDVLGVVVMDTVDAGYHDLHVHPGFRRGRSCRWLTRLPLPSPRLSKRASAKRYLNKCL